MPPSSLPRSSLLDGNGRHHLVRRSLVVLGLLLALSVIDAPVARGLAEGGAPRQEASTTATTAGGSDSSERLPGTTLEAEERDDGGTDAAPWIIGSGIAAAVAVGVGGTILKRRAG